MIWNLPGNVATKYIDNIGGSNLDSSLIAYSKDYMLIQEQQPTNSGGGDYKNCLAFYSFEGSVERRSNFVISALTKEIKRCKLSADFTKVFLLGSKIEVNNRRIQSYPAVCV